MPFRRFLAVATFPVVLPYLLVRGALRYRRHLTAGPAASYREAYERALRFQLNLHDATFAALLNEHTGNPDAAKFLLEQGPAHFRALEVFWDVQVWEGH